MLFLAFAIGIVAGLRAMMAPTAVAWAAASGSLSLEGSWLNFMSWRFTPWLFTIAALAELVTDQLPSTPSRKVPPQFGARVVMGALSGGCIGQGGGSAITGAILGVVGAVVGTYGGSAARAWLASTFGSDRPAAIIEDLVAIAAATAIAVAL